MPTPLDQLLSEGCAVVAIGPGGAAALSTLYNEATEFFRADEAMKLRFGVPDRTNGYRPFGYAHAGDPENPDLNDSFLYWKHRRNIPNCTEITPFLDALENYRAIAAGITTAIIRDLSEHYGYQRALPFETASHLQLNSFGTPARRELLQTRHEDAVLMTVIWTSAPGLECEVDGVMHPVHFAPDEVRVMAGSIMTVMTEGEIQPCYHLARNTGNADRKSVMYFVNPDVDRPVMPFTGNDAGTGIRDIVMGNPNSHFGLSDDFVSP
ncbi:2OG-Fe(II) oxygenase family protein [Nocardia sp. NPDC049190]|uniref:2OG-Fe(II) oxygenase family protein n=1 Tax=Nocardia sp. NPDC049190 TaxID=3155650 RepID=UPI0034012E16